MAKKKPHMSYEEHLDEVTTQITEIYTVEDDEAIPWSWPHRKTNISAATTTT